MLGTNRVPAAVPRSVRRRRLPGRPALLPLLPVLPLLLVAGCSQRAIVLKYPGEALDFREGSMVAPPITIDRVSDLRPAAQRLGQGHFFGITFPKDTAWDRPATEIYGQALAQDLDQTHLVQLVPLPAQAQYVLSADLLSLGCRLQRSPGGLLLAGAIGAGLGMVLGEDASDRAKQAAVFGVLAMAAVPMPAHCRAEAEVRLTLRNTRGETVWQASCLGEYEGKKYMSPTARQDQEVVDEYLTKAIKRANACLLGQLRQTLVDLQAPAAESQ